MAINLWTLGGAFSSYNPLDTTYGIPPIVNIGIGDYVFTFKARKKTSEYSLLGVYRDNSSVKLSDIELTESFVTYTYNIASMKPQTVTFVDNTDLINIEIKDIQLVEKPLGVATINGIDGFLSGKWQMHANARVVDDETLEHIHKSTNGTTEEDVIWLLVQPNTTYTISLNKTPSGTVWVENYTPSKSYISGIISGDNFSTDLIKTFTTPNNGGFIKVAFSSQTNGTYQFKKPMLNLGTIPAPYEKKKGDRMVLPVAKGKNLLPDFTSGAWAKNQYWRTDSPLKMTLNQSVAYQDSTIILPVKIGKTYTLSGKITGNGYAVVRNLASTLTYVTVVGGSFIADTNLVRVTIGSGILNTDIVFENIQLEEGTTATPYEPYAVQVNEKPKVKVAKKNFFSNSNWENGGVTFVLDTTYNERKTVSNQRVRNIVTFNALSNTDYICKIPDDFYIGFQQYDINGKAIFDSTWVWGTYAFKTLSNCASIGVVVRRVVESTLTIEEVRLLNLQIEQGTTATPYEPYTEVLPQAKKGLVMDGVSNYLQLPSMTMDSVEIDCLIDGVQPNGANGFLLDARDGLASGDIQGNGIGVSWSTLTVDGVLKPSKLWTDIPKGQRTKVKITAPTFTDDITLFDNRTGLSAFRGKGILFGVKCYLNGQVVAEYDFTNPTNIIGDKVVPKAKNLIPSFDSGKWNIHPNARVLGKDVLRHEDV